jgi:hypothetical protein
MKNDPMKATTYGTVTQQRPVGIDETSLLLLASSLLEYLREGKPHIDPATQSGQSEIIGLSVNFIVFFVIVWFYRKGYNWSRWAVFVICALSLLEITTLNRNVSLLAHGLTLLDITMAIFLLW